MLKSLLLLSEKGVTSDTIVGCVIGIAVVFVGLICIIGIIELMNRIVAAIESKKPAQKAAPAPAVSAPAASAPIENCEEIVAAVCAAVAEENGTDISAIRVVSFKKL
ncbi:MAG: OadG family protein [Clostridia bacterium]|nr:OadG family protein [Clostridia bacterium]